MAESLGHLTLRSELGSFRGNCTNSGTHFSCGVPWLGSFIKGKAQAHLRNTFLWAPRMEDLDIPSSNVLFIPAPTVLHLNQDFPCRPQESRVGMLPPSGQS